MERITNLLRDLEPKPNDELHAELTTILREPAVFYGMERIAESQLAGEA
jgi:hypothetical protein